MNADFLGRNLRVEAGDNARARINVMNNRAALSAGSNELPKM